MRIGKYETSESGSSTVGTAISFLLIGLGIGAAVGMLLAPKSGKQIRKDLRRSYDDTLDTISEWTDEAKERYEAVVEKGAGLAEELRAKAEPLSRKLRRD
jgi:gas vesicle protein